MTLTLEDAIEKGFVGRICACGCEEIDHRMGDGPCTMHDRIPPFEEKDRCPGFRWSAEHGFDADPGEVS